MTSIMLCGSRRISRVPPAALARLTEHADRGDWFLVGDAPGIDTAFQTALHASNYRRVVVFTSLPAARSNVGSWEVRPIESSLRSKSAALHTVKDRKMVEIADHGLMVWDCESPGTLANVIDFIEAGKASHLWTPQDDLLWEIDSERSLSKLLAGYPIAAAEAQKRLKTFRNRLARQVPPEPPTLFESA